MIISRDHHNYNKKEVSNNHKNGGNLKIIKYCLIFKKMTNLTNFINIIHNFRFYL